MATLLIVAHAPLASALQSVARHAFPERAQDVAAVDVQPGDGIDIVESALRAHSPAGRDLLILADAFGATPCNAALRVADGAHCRVVTGVNVPMIWRALCYLHEPLDSVVARALSGASQGVMQVAATRPQHEPLTTTQDDHDQSHHQQ